MGEHRATFGEVEAELGEDGVAIVTLNRPARLNALTTAVMEAVTRALAWAAGQGPCRVIVLAGAGRAFCAGMDLVDGLSGADDPAADPVHARYEALRAGTAMVLAVTETPQPVIAAVHGPAVGAGFALAVAADLRFCGPGARFDAPFHRLGASAGDLGLSWRLPRLIGPARAARLFYTNGSLSAEEARDLGLAETDPAPLAAALRLAREIAGHPLLGVRMTKELLNASLDCAGFRAHLATEMRSQVIALGTREHADAVAAFRARR
ncbi:enoyl-CoA hydratase/isomerase family protein [Zavarzinia compransoris]|uniref:enoyl-CoA hydratase/isomerase family protein n=1 Tax=Zavarzinia compransoris TaxID=1264899 RepID=UPI0010DD3A87|nr:enoyl-CoA hydratase/isomerase family protein [Zavarzinia compransoris]TDP43587.1 enoyl-CoA hydratase [Zavarzinia compransoris]